MDRRLGIALSLALLATGISPVRAAGEPELTLDGRQFPGAPVVVTQMASFLASGGGRSHRGVCVTFRARGTQALTAVKFAVLSLDEAGKEYQHMTIAREGSFAPSVIIEGNPKVDRRNCVDMDVVRNDAPIVAIRLVAATYADGTTWTAPAADLPPLLARAAAPTPSAATGAAPSWSTSAHAGYLAVGYGRDSARVAVFAPGSTVPSATILLGGCCVSGLAFDATGTLFVATTGAGVAVLSPGSTVPARKLADSGTALAVDAAGNVAVGGERGVHVYPGGSDAGGYAIAGRVPAGGLAYSAAGELAVADADAPNVGVYPRGSATAARTVAVAPGSALVAFDPGGHLAVGNVRARTVTQFEPSAGVRTREIKGPQVRSFAFDAAGRLLIGTLDGVQPWQPGGGPDKMLKGPAADAIAVAPNGTIAAADTVNGVVVLYDGEARTVIAGLDGVRALAVSP